MNEASASAEERAILQHLTRADAVLGALIAAAGPYRPRRGTAASTFDALLRAIAHQQLHGKAAAAILGRLALCFEGRYPLPAELCAMPETQLRAAGFSLAKIASLKDLARRSCAGLVPEARALALLSDVQIIEQLTQVRGIGRWSVQMLLMFELSREDVLPVDDFGVRNGFRLAYGLRKMPPPRALARYGERWAPYRSVAAWYLWRAVELAREGRLPAPRERVRLPRARTRSKRPPARRAAAPSAGAAGAAPPRPKGARTRARPRPAPRSRARAKRR